MTEKLVWFVGGGGGMLEALTSITRDFCALLILIEIFPALNL